MKIPSENSCIVLKTGYRKYFLIITQSCYAFFMLVQKYSLVQLQKIFVIQAIWKYYGVLEFILLISKVSWLDLSQDCFILLWTVDDSDESGIECKRRQNQLI